ncbi:hypothetical protein [Amaricoccus macauensis]|uniref:hypothetical protein n=1 Tax=Amaricoccus macauensis TaxID=57001 RepID=UPI003C7B5050
MIWRAALLGLAMLAGSINGVWAHALPGSVLLLSQQGSTLQLTIQFPAEDLIIAAPELEGLEEVAAGQPLPPELAVALSRYLEQHLSLTENGDPLAPTMTDARVRSTYHDHLGHFALVVSQWHMTVAGDRSTPLVLTYDAVMHEVRNHRATVQWIGQNGASRPVAEFGLFSATDGISLDPRLAAQE